MSTVDKLLAEAASSLRSAANTAAADADDTRQEAEQRAGLDPDGMTDDEYEQALQDAVLADPAYLAVLDRCRGLDELAAAVCAEAGIPGPRERR